MLLSKLRVVFENAGGELELWSKAASSQIDVAAARAPPRLQAAGARRSSASSPRPASSSSASPRSRRRTSAWQHLGARLHSIAAAPARCCARQRGGATTAPCRGRRRRCRWSARAALPVEATAASRMRRRRGDDLAARVIALAARSTAATACPGRARATRTASGCRRSCCSRRRSPRCSTTTRASCSASPMCRRWPRRRWTTCWRCGAAWATTAARATCTAARRWWWPSTAARFPRSSAALATLPGIGRSTAAAIAAFCFGERAAILDGNVKRVLTRALGFGGDLARRGARARAVGSAPRRCCRARGVEAYTQGLMDLGATRVPRAPAALRRLPAAPRCAWRTREGAARALPGEDAQAQAQRGAAMRCCGWRTATRVWLVQRPAARRLGRAVEPARVRLARRAAVAARRLARPGRGAAADSDTR